MRQPYGGPATMWHPPGRGRPAISDDGDGSSLTPCTAPTWHRRRYHHDVDEPRRLGLAAAGGATGRVVIGAAAERARGRYQPRSAVRRDPGGSLRRRTRLLRTRHAHLGAHQACVVADASASAPRGSVWPGTGTKSSAAYAFKD